MAKRVAFVMKLREGVTRGEIRELMALLERVGDPSWVFPTKTNYIADPEHCTKSDCAHWKCRVEEVPVEDREGHIFEKYDDKYGDPCFYIP